MNMKKLLATTAIAALAATAVNAAELTYRASNTAATTAAGNGVAAAGTSIVVDATGSTAQPTIATEVNMAAGIFNYVLDLTDPLPTVTNSILRIELPAGVVFDGAVASGDFAGGESADSDTFVPTSVFNISGGGGGGQNFVNVIISGAGPDEDLFFMDLRLKVNDSECASPGRLKVGISTDSGVPIESGGDGTTAPILQVASTGSTVSQTIVNCTMSLSSTVNVDDGSVGDELANPLFQAFTGVDGLASPNNDNLHADSGDAKLTFGSAPTSFPPNAAAAMDATDVTSVSFTITLGDSAAAGVDELGIDFTNDGVGNVFGVKSGNVFTFTITGGTNIGLLFDGTADQLILGINTASGPATVAAQSVTLDGFTVTFNNASGGTAFDDGSTLDTNKALSGGGLDPLVLEADMFGPFDWVSGASGGIRTIFRMTGMPNASASGLVTFSNCAAGMKDTFPFTYNAPNMGEGLILSDTDLETLNPGYKRCDIKFFVFDNLAGADMDVLNVGTANNVAVPFGDGANAGDSNDEKTTGFAD